MKLKIYDVALYYLLDLNDVIGLSKKPGVQRTLHALHSEY